MSKYWNKHKLSFIINHIQSCEVTDNKAVLQASIVLTEIAEQFRKGNGTGSRKGNGFSGLDPFMPGARLPELTVQL